MPDRVFDPDRRAVLSPGLPSLPAPAVPDGAEAGPALGIDLGTTRTVVAVADRGNYPVVTFADDEGDEHGYIPSLTAVVDGELVHGFTAQSAARDGAPVLRSVKRVLGRPDATALTPVRVGSRELALMDVLVSYLESLRGRLDGAGVAGAARVAVAVPAHAWGAQRMLTLDAFRAAGFPVTALLNEPSAAGFEYTHRKSATLSSRRTRVLVYDLGGGTFDSSLVDARGLEHEVIGSRGLSDVGGDDVDLLIAQLALERAGRREEDLTDRELTALLDQCREGKESLAPQTRRLALEVAGAEVVVRVEDVYERCTPLLSRTIQEMEPLARALEGGDELRDVAGIYLVGGASCLPLVPRLLRRRFGARVHRSPYPAASTAIGLAIAADGASGVRLTDRLARAMGVFREADDGRRTAFDLVLPPLSLQEGRGGGAGTVVTREYPVVHDIGRYRFVECSGVDAAGEPRGTMTPAREVLFPFDAHLRAVDDLSGLPVHRLGRGPRVQERYEADANGVVRVTLTDLTDGYSRTYVLGASAVTRLEDAAGSELA